MNSTTAAFISIIGRPNVGKSSFIHSALGQKVSIVSDKPQTTRTKIMGVLTRGAQQLVFIDTPGFHKPRNVLGENMMKAVGTGLTDVDAAVLIVEAVPKFKFDPDNLPPAELELIETLKHRKLKAILLIKSTCSKIKRNYLKLSQHIHLFMISKRLCRFLQKRVMVLIF